MLNILICFSLVFSPSMQAFAQSGAAQPKKEGARFADPRLKYRTAELSEQIEEKKDGIEQTRKDVGLITLSADESEQYKQQIKDARAKLDQDLEELKKLEEDLSKEQAQVSCFDLFALESYRAPIAGSIFSGLLTTVITVPLVLEAEKKVERTAAIGWMAALATGVTLGTQGTFDKTQRAYKLASRFDVDKYGAETTLAPKDRKKLAEFKSRILKYYNRQLPRGTKDATIDDVRAVMVEGFNSGNFCRAEVPKSNDTALMNKRQMNRYIVAKLAERLGSAPSNTTGSSSGSRTNSAGGVQTAE